MKSKDKMICISQDQYDRSVINRLRRQTTKVCRDHIETLTPAVRFLIDMRDTELTQDELKNDVAIVCEMLMRILDGWRE